MIVAEKNRVSGLQSPGRLCPLHCRYRPEDFAVPAPADQQAPEVLYVVGGLYGNELALARVLELFDAERGRKRLVFNGDFHWFDADLATFARVQQAVLAHGATRGNVETELATEGEGADAGCGCAYPNWVGESVVERSNRILGRLRLATSAPQRAELSALPMWQRADVGSLRLGLVHGDATSLAGWGFAQVHLRDPGRRAEVARWLDRAVVDAFAIVGSDSDFTGLASRLRRGGKCVFGFGAEKKPASFRNACDDFILTEYLGAVPVASTTPAADPGGESPEERDIIALLKAAASGFAEGEGWTLTSHAGNTIRRQRPDFSPKAFGCRSLGQVISKFDRQLRIARSRLFAAICRYRPDSPGVEGSSAASPDLHDTQSGRERPVGPRTSAYWAYWHRKERGRRRSPCWPVSARPCRWRFFARSCV